MHSKNRPLSFEPLEPREYLSATTTLDTNPADEIRANIAATLVGRGTTWTEADYPALLEAAQQDPAFADLATISGAAEEEGDAWQTDKDRLSVLRLDRTEMTSELQRDETSLAQAEKSLAAISEHMDAIHARETLLTEEIAALTAKDATLHTEQEALPQRLASARTELQGLQTSMKTVTKQEQVVLKSLTPLRATYQRQQNYLQSLNTNLESHPGDRFSLQQRAFVTRWLRNYGPSLRNLEQKDTMLRGKIDLLGKQVEEAARTIATLESRQAALPGEMQSADAAIGEDAALLHTTQEEEAQTVLAGEEQLRARDAVLAEVTGDQTSLAATDAAMEEVTADIAAHEEILAELSATVRTSAAEILADTTLNTVLTTSMEKTDTLALDTGTFDDDSSSLTLSLAELGGTAQFDAFQGRSSIPGTLSVADTAALRRAVLAAGLTPDQVASAPNLCTVLGIKDGQFSSWGTVTSAALGTVTIAADTNRPYDPVHPPHYLTIRDGIIQAYETPNAMGCAPITLTFATPRYVQWVDVRHVSGQEGGILDITAADGTVRSVSIGSGGPVMVDAVVQNLKITTQGSNAAYGFRALQGYTSTTVPQVPDGTWMQATGVLTALDLSGSERRVTGVDVQAKSDRMGDTITVEGYSGSNKVVSQAVGADGTAHLAYEGGLTHVMLCKANTASTLLVSGCTVTGTLDQDQPASAPLSPESNGTYGYITGQDFQWDGVPFNHIDTARQNPNVYYGGGSSAVWSGSILNLPQSINDPTTYNRHEFRSAKSITVSGLYYVCPDGLHSVPSEYWKSLGSCFITFPGAPKYLVVLLKGPGGAYDTVMPAEQGETCAEVMPNQTMSIESGVLVVRQGGLAEGWQEVPEAVPSANFRSNGGDTVNVLFQIMNLGMQGGTFTARIHSGPSGSIADPVVKEFTGSIGALGKTALSVNVGIANAGDSVTLEVIDSNGVTTCYKRRIQQARPEEYATERRMAAMSTRRWQTLYSNVNEALHQSTMPGIVKILEVVRQNPVATEQMRQRLIAQAILEVVEEAEPELTDDETLVKSSQLLAMGNTDVDIHELLQSSTADGYNQMLQWFDTDGYRAEDVRDDTAMGKIFLGLVQKLISHAELHAGTAGDGAITKDPHFEEFLDAARAVGNITGIPFEKILHAADLQQSFPDRASAEQAMVAALKALFNEGQYGGMFQTENSIAPNSVLGAHVGKPASSGAEYTDDDESVRLRFDFTSSDLTYDHGNVYLIDASGNQIGGVNAALVPGDFRNTLYVDVAMSSIRALFPDGIFHGQVSAKLVLWDKAGNPVTDTSERFELNLRGGIFTSELLSARENTPENARKIAIENAILQRTDAPLDLSQHPWRRTLSSPSHSNLSYNAVDLNYGSENADIDQPVFAAADGKIVYINESLGEIIVEHSSFIVVDGQRTTIQWRTTYMHMTQLGYFTIENIFVSWKVDDQIKHGNQLGLTGATGTKYSHLHFEIALMNVLDEWQSVGLTQWLNHFGVDEALPSEAEHIDLPLTDEDYI